MFSYRLSQPHQEVAATSPSCFLLLFRSTQDIWKPGSKRGHCKSRMILCLATSHDHLFSHKSQNLEKNSYHFDLASRLSDRWPISGKTKNRKLLLKVKSASPPAGLESPATRPPSNHILLTLITSNKTKQKPPRGLPFPKTAVQRKQHERQK